MKTKREKRFLYTGYTLLVIALFLQYFSGIDPETTGYRILFSCLVFILSIIGILFFIKSIKLVNKRRDKEDEKKREELLAESKRKFLRSMKGLTTKDERLVFLLGAKSAIESRVNPEAIEEEISSLK